MDYSKLSHLELKQAIKDGLTAKRHIKFVTAQTLSFNCSVEYKKIKAVLEELAVDGFLTRWVNKKGYTINNDR